jgi:hypothetical protein
VCVVVGVSVSNRVAGCRLVRLLVGGGLGVWGLLSVGLFHVEHLGLVGVCGLDLEKKYSTCH